MSGRIWLAVSIILFVTTSRAIIINVPADQSTIQAAINSAVNGDTVLVQPGTYVENINFEGNNIVVASLFVTTRDESYIPQTVIDGNGNGTVVTFHNGEDSTAVLSGFTITNGFADYGGGISCSWETSPTLDNLIIQNNGAAEHGGGILCWSATPRIQDVLILDNYCYNAGGGISAVASSRPILYRVTVAFNEAEVGGGIYLLMGSGYTYLTNVTVAHNTAFENGGMGGVAFGSSHSDATAIIVNSIVWNNTNGDAAITFPWKGSAEITYSDVGGGWAGEGNFSADPVFANPDNRDFQLTSSSPCIDTGDPSSPPDPDGTRADIGAHPFDQNSPQLIANFTLSTYEGFLPLTVNFQDASTAYNTEITAYYWDFDGDDIIDSEEQNPQWTYEAPGIYTVKLTITDGSISSSFIRERCLNVRDTAAIIVSLDGSDEVGDGTVENPFATIGRGIQRALQNGDTIIVMPGTYYEKINYSGKNITIGSQFLATGDTSFISQTVLHGSRNGGVVIFNHGESSAAVLSGFTITGGIGYLDRFRLGGGIYLEDSHPTLEHLVIRGNTADYGGGIHCEGASPVLQDVFIIDNHAMFGGGICCFSSNMSLERVVIWRNSALGDTYSNGGGIFGMGSNPRLNQVTVANNTTEPFGGGVSCSSIRITNSILWDNSPVEILWDANVSYSDIMGGYPGIGNINRNPLFIDPINGDFYLTEDSPCIDTGDPSSELDPDSTASDMGAYYYSHETNIPRVLADFIADETTGLPPLTVQFQDASLEYFTGITTWMWDFDNGGTTDSEEQNPQWEYTTPGAYSVALTVTDGNITNKIVKESYIVVGEPGPIFVSATGSDETGNGSSENPFASIQKGIDIATPGRKVLVMPGTYYENLDYRGKGILVTSLYLTTKDTSDIVGTVIDGGQNGSVISFMSGEDSTAMLCGFTITNGLAHEMGGGIVCKEEASPKLMNLIITGNSSPMEGGGIACYRASPMLIDVIISNNTSKHGGGGLACIFESDATIKNTEFFGNVATDGDGGGLFCMESSPTLENVVFYDNFGNAGGAIHCMLDSQPILNHVTIYGNTARWDGGGIVCMDFMTHLILLNSIVWGNQPQAISLMDASLSVAYSDVQGGESGVQIIDFNEWNTVFWLEGNIDKDPLFANTTDGDFHLPNYSPCIGAGIDSVQIDSIWYYAPLADVEDNPRPDPPGSNPDMGAYENPLGQRINALPTPFALMTPHNDTSLVITTDNIGDSLIFDWEDAIDFDEDTIRYSIVTTGDLDIVLNCKDTTSSYLSLPHSAVLDRILTAGMNAGIAGTWMVYAKDGKDSTWASPYPYALTINVGLAIDPDIGLPDMFALHAAYPNPFNPASTIRYDLPQATNATLVVYDLLGREVVRLADGYTEPGYYEVHWGGRDKQGNELPSGIYIARLVTQEYSKSIKMVLLK